MNLPVENPISAGRDVAPAARRLSAAMSGTLGDLVDGVAAFDRIVAWAPAGRATMIDEARRWSELTEHAAARRAHRPDTARRLAGHAPSFTRILIHPETGSVLSVGRTRCKVPKDLRDWLRVWDETWRFPGCNRNAANCDIDHSHDWDFGGPTSHDNLAHACPRTTS